MSPRARFFGCGIGPALLCLASCDGESIPQGPGVDLPAGPCGRALYLVQSDFQSSTVSVVGWDGVVHAAPLISSGSSEAGLSLALSGDVVAAGPRDDGEVVLVDRFPAAVVSLIDPAAAEVTAQFNVQTGFASNPQDAARLGDRLFVARLGVNPSPGREPFDGGDDVIAIDVPARAIAARVDLAPALAGASPGVRARPLRLAAGGGRLWALLGALEDGSFKPGDDGRVVEIDPARAEIVSTLVLPDGRGCTGLALDAERGRLLVTCSGGFDADLNPISAESALFLVDVASDPPAVLARLAADDVAGASFGFSVAFAGPDAALTTTFGALDPQTSALVTPDRLIRVDLASGAFEELAVTKEKAFSLGDVRCEAACGCFAADADARVLRRFSLGPSGLAPEADVIVDDGSGLPPRYLGGY